MTIPNPKWAAAGKQLILKTDFINIESAIVGQTQARLNPNYSWVDIATLRVVATADSPASMKLDGFPNILNPNTQINGGLTDLGERSNISNVSMFMAAGGLYGNEKSSQLYALFATAANVDTTFTLKSMPFMAVKSQAGQVISLGTLLVPATGIGYGFTTDELVGSMIYILSGASQGLLRTITANNNDNSTGGTITYSGTALTLAQSDIFIVFPPGTNFRYLGCFFNNASANITNTNTGPNSADFVAAGTYLWIVIAPVTSVSVYGEGGGGGGGGGDNGSYPGGNGAGATPTLYPVSYTIGSLLTVIVGAGGAQGGVGYSGSSGGVTYINGAAVGRVGDGGSVGGNGGNNVPTIILGPNYGYGGLGSLSPNEPGRTPGYHGCLFLWW